MVDYIKQIEEKGYCRIPQVLSPEQVQQAMDLTGDWGSAGDGFDRGLAPEIR